MENLLFEEDIIFFVGRAPYFCDAFFVCPHCIIRRQSESVTAFSSPGHKLFKKIFSVDRFRQISPDKCVIMTSTAKFASLEFSVPCTDAAAAEPSVRQAEIKNNGGHTKCKVKKNVIF